MDFILLLIVLFFYMLLQGVVMIFIAINVHTNTQTTNQILEKLDALEKNQKTN